LTEPVDVFELVEASAIRRRLQAAATRGLTRFVGRETELVALQQALAQAEAGQGQVVALVGGAGGWKSGLGFGLGRSHPPPGLAGAGERLGLIWQTHAVFRDCSESTGFSQSVQDEVMQGFVDGLRRGLLATYPAQDGHGSARASARDRHSFASCDSADCP